MNTFTLSVRIDGDHIENDHHVAEVLRAVADTLCQGDESRSNVTAQPVGIYSDPALTLDVPRRVGEWAVTPAETTAAVPADVTDTAAARVLTRYGVEANGDASTLQDMAWALGGEITYEDGLRAFAAEVIRAHAETGAGQ